MDLATINSELSRLRAARRIPGADIVSIDAQLKALTDQKNGYI